jgi:hypothetical protein
MHMLCTLYGAVDLLIVQCDGLYGWGGGGGSGAGQLSSFVHLSGPSRAIKYLYAPASPTPHSMGPETSLVVYLWLTYVYAYVGMLVCTSIMMVCTRRPLQGGLLYIKPPMHL